MFSCGEWQYGIKKNGRVNREMRYFTSTPGRRAGGIVIGRIVPISDLTQR